MIFQPAPDAQRGWPAAVNLPPAVSHDIDRLRADQGGKSRLSVGRAHYLAYTVAAMEFPATDNAPMIFCPNVFDQPNAA